MKVQPSHIIRRSFALDAIWVLISQLSGRCAFFVTSILFARTLSVGEFALYGYAYLTATLMSSCSILGMRVVISKSYARLLRADDGSPDIEGDGVAHEEPANLLFLSMGAYALVGVVVLLLPEPVSRLDREILSGALGLGACLVLNAFATTILIAVSEFRRIALVSSAAGLFLIIWAANPLRLEADARYALLGVIAFTFMQAFALYATVFVKLGRRSVIGGRVTFRTVSWVVREAGPLALTSILASTLPWMIGRYLVGLPDGAERFAMYNIGMQWFALAMLVATVLGSALVPRLIGGTGHGEGSADIRYSLSASLLFVTFLSLVALLVGDNVSWLYGGEYDIGGLFLFGYMMPAVFASIAAICGQAILYIGSVRTWLRLTIVWFVVGSLALGLSGFTGLNGSSDVLLLAYLSLAFLSFVTTIRMGIL